MNQSFKDIPDIIERISDAFVALDNNWCYNYMNKKAGEIFNRDPATMIGKHIWTEFPEGIDQPFYKAYYKAMAEQCYVYLEEYYPPYDRWFENHIYPSPEGLSIFFRDITEKKKVEEVLNQNRIFIESIINASPDIIYIYDIEERKNVYINDGIQKNLGFSDVEIKQMGDEVLPMLMHPGDFDCYIQKTYPKYATAKDKEIIIHEFRMKDKKGNWHWLYCKESIFLRKPDGTPKQIFGITTDITERKKTEEALFESREKIIKIFRSVGVGMLIQGPSAEILFSNESALNMLGLTEDQILGKTSFDPDWNVIHEDGTLFPGPDHPVPQAIAHKKSIINVVMGVFRPRTKDRVWLLVNAEPELDTDGNVKEVICSFSDITEIKKGEEEIQKLATIFQRSPQFIGIASLDGKGVYINDGGKKIVSLNRDVTTTTMFDYFAPQDLELLQTEILPAIQKHGRWSGDFHLRNFQTGDRIPVLMDGFYIYHPATQKPIALATITADITERKKAEADLATAHDRLLFHLENSPLGYIEWDKNLYLKSWTKRVEEIFGWGEKEFIEKKKNGFSLVYDEDVPELSIVAQQLMSGEVERNHMIHRNFTKKGEVIWCEWFNSVLKDKEGNVITIMSLVQDITERRKMELALAENENYLGTILETEPECVKILNKRGELLSMNPAGLAMIEATHVQEVLGHQMNELVDAKYRKAFSRLTKQVFQGSPGILEFEITGLKGGRRWLETHAVPLKNVGGKTINLLGVTRDITERKKAELEIMNNTEQLRQLTGHLQSIREEERKRIGREIHDDLGQQLTAIKMDIAWIDKKTPNESEPIKTKLKNIITLLDGSNQSVRRILNELRPGILDDYGLLEALKWHGYLFTQTTGIPISFKIPEIEFKLETEIANCLYRVYQEALTNIMRYAKAKKVFVSLRFIDNSIHLSIRDNGKGFDNTIQTGRKSFGILGMKERVLALSGTFELTSILRKGTEIKISLPFRK